MEEIVGIDYGAKLSGNTVIAYIRENGVLFDQVERNKDTDNWLIIKLKDHNFKSVYLDAPMSLPLAYYGKGNNFHYRECDVTTKAMSPMFLGGLTARAISLRNQLSTLNFNEVYPAHFQRTIIKSEYYKKDIALFLTDFHEKIDITVNTIPKNWHQVDALLALTSGIRHHRNKHITIGNPKEGIIVI